MKPLDGNHGRGVRLDLRSEDDVRAAFPDALAESRSGDVVVETYVAGNDYRVLVIGGKLAAVAERVPASVTGDGEHTVRQLVDIANSDPRRGIECVNIWVEQIFGEAIAPHQQANGNPEHERRAQADGEHVQAAERAALEFAGDDNLQECAADGARIREKQRIDLPAEDFPQRDHHHDRSCAHRAEMIDEPKRPRERQIEFGEGLLL